MIQNKFRNYPIYPVYFLWLLFFTCACQQTDSPLQGSQFPQERNNSDISVTSTREPITIVQNTLTPTATFTPTPTLTVVPTSTTMPSATPTSTRLDGWIVFESRRQDTNEDGIIDSNDGTHIYSLHLESEQLVQLTSGHHRDFYPTWSPDGNQIAFVSDRVGNFDLYVMNADGSDVRQLTNTPENETSPAWSPTGTEIAYVLVKTLDSGDQEKTLHLIAGDGSDQHQIDTETSISYAPSWSPDGRYLAFNGIETFTKVDGGTFYRTIIYLMDMQTNQIFRLTAPSIESEKGEFFEYPRWLPRDGYFLSMEQVPGNLSSVGMKVFEILWENDSPILSQVLSINDIYGPSTWGTNGEWFISIVSNDKYFGEIPDDALNDLSFLPVELDLSRTQSNSDPTKQNSQSQSLMERILITDNMFYEGYPDWIAAIGDLD